MIKKILGGLMMGIGGFAGLFALSSLILVFVDRAPIGLVSTAMAGGLAFFLMHFGQRFIMGRSSDNTKQAAPPRGQGSSSRPGGSTSSPKPSASLLKARQILLDRTDVPEDEINALSSGEAWDLIYELDAQKRRARPKFVEVCFTGLRPGERDKWTARVTQLGLKVRTSVTKKLNILVCGPNAGPSKMAQAKQAGVKLLSLEEFAAWLETDYSKVNNR